MTDVSTCALPEDYLGKNTPKLGFGLMRLPKTEDDQIDVRTVLCLNNLSSSPQSVTVQLPPEFAGARLRDLFGGAHFPVVADDGKATFTLGSRDFFWLSVRPDESK